MLKWTNFLVLVVAVILRLGYCDGAEPKAKTCNVAHDTDKIKTWFGYCEANENMECIVPKGGGPQCICKTGFTPDGPDICIAKICDDEHDVDESKTWNEFCQANKNMECTVPEDGTPRCTCKTGFTLNSRKKCRAITCNDAHDTVKIKTWNGFCESNGNMECTVPRNGRPQCTCKTGFTPDGPDNCIAKTCDDGHDMNVRKTWKEICRSRTNMECTVPWKGTPKCTCKKGFTLIAAGNCRAKTCNDEHDTDKLNTWYGSCQSKENMQCILTKNGNPQCVCKTGFTPDGEDKCRAKICDDDHDVDEREIWDDICQSKENMECTVPENGTPGCTCKTGYLPNGPNNCRAKTCNYEHDVYTNQTWFAFCESNENMICTVPHGGTPQCICRIGFTRAGPEKCKDKLECLDEQKVGQSWKESCALEGLECVDPDKPYQLEPTCEACSPELPFNSLTMRCEEKLTCLDQKEGRSWKEFCALEGLECVEKANQLKPTCNDCPPRSSLNPATLQCEGYSCDSIKEGSTKTWTEYCGQWGSRACVENPREGPKCLSRVQRGRPWRGA